MEEKKYPIGGFAPGNYTCKCCICKQEFQGDKRAVQCEPCALEAKARFDALDPNDKELLIKRNARIANYMFSGPLTPERDLIYRIVEQWGNAIEMPNMEQWLKDYAATKQTGAGREEDAVDKEKAKAGDEWKDSLIKHDNVLVRYKERPAKYTEPFTFEEFKAVMLEKSPVFIYNTMYSENKPLYQITSRFMPSGVNYFATSWADKTPQRKTLEQFYKMLKLDGLENISF